MRTRFIILTTLLLALSLATACSTGVSVSTEANLHRGRHAPTPSPTAAVPESLTVVSYNIEFGLDVPGAFEDLDIHPLLRDADIYLLQEMGPASTDSIARLLGCDYVYCAAYVSPSAKQLFGNAVLSRWPIVSDHILSLPHGNPVTGHRRLAVAADLDVGGVRMRAVSVHTATLIVPQDDRIEQAAAILDSLARAPGPSIIGGDFNTVLSYEEMMLRRLYRHAGFAQARLPYGATARTRPFWSRDPGLVLDHIFYRGLNPGETGILYEAEASDHFPIWATFALPDSMRLKR